MKWFAEQRALKARSECSAATKYRSSLGCKTHPPNPPPLARYQREHKTLRGQGGEWGEQSHPHSAWFKSALPSCSLSSLVFSDPASWRLCFERLPHRLTCACASRCPVSAWHLCLTTLFLYSCSNTVLFFINTHIDAGGFSYFSWFGYSRGRKIIIQ